MTHDLLFEIGCEDLPARFVAPLADALARSVVDSLDIHYNLDRGAIKSFASPRRIAVLAQQVVDQQPEQNIERRGPALNAAYKDGAPTPAALGFAKSCGVEFEKLEKLETDKGSWLVFRSTQPGRKTVEIIPEIFQDALKAMDGIVPKRMRWGESNETFVRPVHWLLAMFGSDIVPLARFGLTAGNVTYGHRFHAPKAIALKSPGDYEKKLLAAKVWADFASRRDEIRRQIETKAKELKGFVRITDELLTEVTALVEWPVAIAGQIEPRFLSLPPEVIVATVETNQRYFTVFKDAALTQLLPCFITVSNIESHDVSQVITGNERVVRPRLTDALFFWEQDRKKPLEDYLEALDRVTFANNLGTLLGKTRRIEALADRIASVVGADRIAAKQTAELCKADLVTRMVYEYPELQGVMGGYYAANTADPAAVLRNLIAAGITEHYRPTQAGGAIPSTMLGRIIAIADKLDTVAGIFSTGQKPTASKDPFALRRAALGVLRILIEGGLPLHLHPMLQHAINAQPGRGKNAEADATLCGEILDFIFERLRAYCLDFGVAPEVYESVLATGTDSPLDFANRIKAVQEFLKLPQAQQLSAAHKRVRNILRQTGKSIDGAADPALFSEDAERELHKAVELLESEMQLQIQRGEYRAALSGLAQLQAQVDRFFDGVMVMDENPAVRENRLRLLARLDENCRRVADISCLPGQ